MLKGKNKYIFIIIAVTALCVIEIGWAMIPLVKKIYTKNKAVTEQKEELLNLLKQGQSVKQNKEDLKKINSKKYIFEQSWLKIDDELRFITDLEKIAKANNLEQTIKFDNTDFKLLDKEIRVIPVDLHLNAELVNFMNYIGDIEKLDYYINFKNIKITSNNKAKIGPHQLNINDNTQQANKNNLVIQLSGESYWK